MLLVAVGVMPLSDVCANTHLQDGEDGEQGDDGVDGKVTFPAAGMMWQLGYLVLRAALASAMLG